MRLVELIQDNKGRLSSSKVGYLAATVVLLGIAVHMEFLGKTDADVLGIIAAMAAGTHFGNRFSESTVERAEVLRPSYLEEDLKDESNGRRNK